jgi:hypothetical protein
MAAELMKAPMERWKAAGGGPAPRDVTANPQGKGGGDSGDVYESWAQLTKDRPAPPNTATIRRSAPRSKPRSHEAQPSAERHTHPRRAT